MAVGPIEAQRRAPVVDHERYSLSDTELFEQRIEVAAVFDERVRRGPTVGELGGIAHADEVRRDAPPPALTVRAGSEAVGVEGVWPSSQGIRALPQRPHVSRYGHFQQ
jgi:hypothetical protein